VEIARAVHFDARILVMDEPTTPLSSHETDRLFALIRQLRTEGLAIIYISHRMAEIDELADRVSVMRDGCYVGTLLREQMTQDVIVKMMVGRDLSSFYRKEHQGGSRGPIVLTARSMADGRRVRGCSLDVHAGEVLGLAGLVGAGRTELARLIFGADRRTAGELELGGHELTIHQPIDAIRSGIVYLTEDRKGQGLFLDLSVHENINVMVCPRDALPGGVMDRKRAAHRSAEAIKRMGVRTPSPKVNVGALSGGNQQKVLLARLLETAPRVLILDEPTRGVDIGAKSEIYRLIDELARSGVAVLVISSDLPEVMGICDRVLVMREGHLVGEVGGESGRPLTQEAVVGLATGAAEEAAQRPREPAHG
jgi:ribose transport system ATP-binding protein